MFDQTFVNSQAQTRRPWTVVLSLAMQTGLVAIALIMPLLHPEMLHPKPDTPTLVMLTQFRQQPTTEVRAAARPVKTAPRTFVGPSRIPERIAKVIDIGTPAEPEYTGTVAPSIGMDGGEILPGLLSGSAANAPPPRAKPAVPKPADASGPVSVSTGVQAAKLIFGLKPVYPPLARASRTQGTVKLQAIIATDGSIRHLQVLGGPPLLTKAAVEAVQQWRYQPTRLNGSVVEVITEIDVVFMLNQ
jgi:protein TonB